MRKEKDYTSIRLTKETVKRLQSRGKFTDSYESIIRELLDKTESGNTV
jgi:predicted DNA-binding protein